MKYFTFEEFERSATAEKLGIDNRLTDRLKANVEYLVEHLLDPIRGAFRKPIIITSGYRCPELNKAVGGVSNSDHLKGLAADFTAGKRELNEDIFDIVTNDRLPFKQFIVYGRYEWFHISIELPKWEVIFKKAKS